MMLYLFQIGDTGIHKNEEQYLVIQLNHIYRQSIQCMNEEYTQYTKQRANNELPTTTEDVSSYIVRNWMRKNGDDILTDELMRWILNPMKAMLRWTHGKLWRFYVWTFDGACNVYVKFMFVFVCVVAVMWMWISTYWLIYVQVMLSSFSKDRVPSIRDYHHGPLAFVALLYGTWSRHEATTYMYSAYIAYYCPPT